MVDFILQRTLSDVRKDGVEEDIPLIALECGHIFTVETLDGHCGLSGHYTQDSTTGGWNGLKNLYTENGLPTPIPRCPNCRKDIDSPRYNRVIKRAKLDLMENNVAKGLSIALEKARSFVGAFDRKAAKERAEREAAASAPMEPSPIRPATAAKQAREEAKMLSSDSGLPVIFQRISGLAKIHDISQSWHKIVVGLITAYGQALAVAQKRSAHREAFEAAFAHLYREALQTAIPQGHVTAQQQALRLASLRVGQPKPLADLRFAVEAFWTTLEIRFALAEITQSWMESLPASSPATSEHRRRWSLFIHHLYQSIESDARQALRIATDTSSYRQVVQCHLFVQRGIFERFQFDYQMSEDQLSGDSAAELLSTFKDEIANRIESFEDVRRAVKSSYLAMFQPGIDRENARVWLVENWDEPCKVRSEAWISLKRSIDGGVFYTEFTASEMTMIVKAMEFGELLPVSGVSPSLICNALGYRGHFYRCPNGHTYTIGEVCPFAMSR